MVRKPIKKVKLRQDKVDMAEPIPEHIQKLSGKAKVDAFLKWHLDKISRLKQ